MPPKSYLPGQLKSSDSIKLGRLVRNVKQPQQEFHDPFPGRPHDLELSTNSQTNFQHANKLSTYTKFQSYLTDILSIRGEVRNNRIDHMIAPQVMFDELQNSSSWYENACGNENTKQWIEKSFLNGYDVYLIVGSFILRDAKLVRKTSSGREARAGAELSLAPLSTAVECLASPGSLKTVVKCIQGATYGHMTAFEAPGDQVFGIRYRKVKFKFFSSRKVDNSFLDSKTRWKDFLQWRGDDDEEDEEDILEASLTDDDLETPDGRGDNEEEEEIPGDSLIDDSLEILNDHEDDDEEEVPGDSLIDDGLEVLNDHEDEDEEMLMPKNSNDSDSEMSEEGVTSVGEMECDEVDSTNPAKTDASHAGDSSYHRAGDHRQEQGKASMTRLPKLSKKRRKRLLKRLLGKSKKPRRVELQDGRGLRNHGRGSRRRGEGRESTGRN